VGNFYSGFYFTPTNATNAANTTNSTGATQRPNVVAGCNPNLSGCARSYTHWFNTACYVSPALYTFGNAGRNSLLGPKTKSVDMSLFKTFSLTPEGRAAKAAKSPSMLSTAETRELGASVMAFLVPPKETPAVTAKKTPAKKSSAKKPPAKRS
jgi:hypothetical protein